MAYTEEFKEIGDKQKKILKKMKKTGILIDDALGRRNDVLDKMINGSKDSWGMLQTGRALLVISIAVATVAIVGFTVHFSSNWALYNKLIDS